MDRLPPAEQVRKNINTIIDEIGPIINETYRSNLNIDEAKNSVITGSAEEAVTSHLSDMGISVEGGLGSACTFPLPIRDPNKIEQIIWFDSSDPNLQHTENFQRNPIGTLMVVEELSHFAYRSNYYKTNGELPAIWMEEFIACLDKYNISNYLYFSELNRPMNASEDKQMRNIIFAAANIQNRNSIPRLNMPDEDHIIGHTLGLETVNYLNSLHNSGRSNEIPKILAKIYNADKRTLDQLLGSMRSR